MEVVYAKLNEKAETATGIYSVISDSLQYIYPVPVTKNHRNIWSRCLVHEFFFTYIFNVINHGYRAAILKKYLCNCFHFICLWLLISIMKKRAERCALQLYQTSLTATIEHMISTKLSDDPSCQIWHLYISLCAAFCLVLSINISFIFFYLVLYFLYYL